jgi:DNA mismatch repair protein MutS
VIERAKVVLAKLEAEDRAAPRGFEDLPLFAATPVPPGRPQDTALEAVLTALTALHPDEMSPREALEALYALKTKAVGNKAAAKGT